MPRLAPIRSVIAAAALLTAAAGCVPPAETELGVGAGADAGVTGPDVDLGEPDAAPGEPDAAPGETDAAPGEPDATPGEPDAAPGETDAAPGETELVPVPASRPAIAAGSSGAYLTAWIDERGDDTDIYAARLDGDGRVLDVGGVAISTQPGNESTPAVAHGGDLFLVVWMDRRGGGTAIFGARVAADGTVLDPDGLRISPAGDTGVQHPAVASTGDGFLVVYEGRCGAGCLGAVATPVSAAGAVGSQRLLSATGRNPAVVAQGDRYLAAYSDVRSGGHDIYAQLVADDGSLLGAEQALCTAATSQVAPAVAAGPDGFLVVWQDLRNQAVELYGARLDADAAPLDPGGFLVATSARWQDGPALAFAGDQYLLSWSRAGASGTEVELHTAQIDPDTGAVSASSLASAAPSAGGSPVHDDKHPALAASGDQVLLAWQERPEAAVYGCVLDPTGAPVSAEPIALAAEPAP